MNDSSEATTPLDGIRVLEIGQVISAPYAGLLLAQLGAEVIKIEPPGGDSARNPEITGMAGDISATFVTFNRSKRSVALDLRSEAGYAEFAELATSADAIISNQTPDTAEKLRTDAASVRLLNPGLVFVSIQGFTRKDPRSSLPSYDLIHQALSGLMSVEGREGDPPSRVAIPIADLSAGLFAANAVLAGLLARERRAVADDVEVSMYASTLSLLTYTATLYLTEGHEPKRMGSRHEFAAPWETFETVDRAIVVAVRSETFWHRLCEALGRHDLVVDPRFRGNRQRLAHRNELAALLGDVFGRETAQHWVERLSAARVPVALVRTVGEALDEAVKRDDSLIESFQQPNAGEILVVASPLRFDRLAAAPASAAPELGEATNWRDGW